MKQYSVQEPEVAANDVSIWRLINITKYKQEVAVKGKDKAVTSR